MMRIVCISDTHLVHATSEVHVPDGDLLIHAGDATYMGNLDEIRQFNAWLSAFPHEHKIFVAGNHDWAFQLEPAKARALLSPEIIYLEDSETRVGGLRIYGSPWQPEFMDWAFNLERGEPLRQKWRQIPTGIDILITHGPPFGILDCTVTGDETGCHDLLAEVTTRIRPKLHLFGHIHEDYGLRSVDDITFVNSCIVDEAYTLANEPIVIELD